MNADELSSIWKRIKRGDHSAYEQLYHRYFDLLWVYGKSLTQDEIIIKEEIQNLFLYIWEQRKETALPLHVNAYIYRAFRNNLLRSLSHQSKIDPLNIDLSEEEETIDTSQQQCALKKAIAQLPPRQKEAISLRYFQGMDHEEIARVMDMNYQSVSNLIARAVKKIRELMSDNRS